MQPDHSPQVLVSLQGADLIVQQLKPSTGVREESAEDTVLAEQCGNHSESTERGVDVGEQIGDSVVGVVGEQHGIGKGTNRVVEEGALWDVQCIRGYCGWFKEELK